MEKITVYGLPINPMSMLEQLKGSSFCVSYGTRKKLGKQLDDAIRLVGSVENSILLVDNGAFSAFQSGVDTMNDEAYLQGFADWANEITERCPQAVVVLPDVIGGTAEQNHQLICETMTMLDACDRAMAMWHTNEPIEFLLHLCEDFNFIGIGTVDDHAKPGSKKWHARMREVFAAIDAWEVAGEGSVIRPRIHLMRAQQFAHMYPVDSSDSVNVAMNHNRQLKKSGETVASFAARVDNKIQLSAGPAAEHQIKRPLEEQQVATNAFSAALMTDLGFEVKWIDGDGKEDETQLERLMADGQAAFDRVKARRQPEPHPLDIPEFLRRAA
jgi:hypothetical protein